MGNSIVHKRKIKGRRERASHCSEEARMDWIKRKMRFSTLAGHSCAASPRRKRCLTYRKKKQHCRLKAMAELQIKSAGVSMVTSPKTTYNSLSPFKKAAANKQKVKL